MNISINEELKELGIGEEEFRDLIVFLMDRGIIVRGDSENERDAYDLFVKAKNAVMEHFHWSRLGIYHNENSHTIRLFAPDADFPSNHLIVDDEYKNSQMRMSIGNDLSAALIVCYLLHRQMLAEGKVLENYSVPVSKEEFYTAHATKLSFTPSKSKAVQQDVMKSLQRLKVVAYNKDFFDNPSAKLEIRPYIFDVVLNETIESTLASLKDPHEN